MSVLYSVVRKRGEVYLIIWATATAQRERKKDERSSTETQYKLQHEVKLRDEQFRLSRYPTDDHCSGGVWRTGEGAGGRFIPILWQQYTTTMPSMAPKSNGAVIDDYDSPRTIAPLAQQTRTSSPSTTQGSQPSSQSQPQQQRRLRSSASSKLKLKSLSSPTRMRRPNSAPQSNDKKNGVVNGEMQSRRTVHSGKTLESYVLPPNLRMGGGSDVTSSGMEVIKVSKVSALTLCSYLQNYARLVATLTCIVCHLQRQ